MAVSTVLSARPYGGNGPLVYVPPSSTGYFEGLDFKTDLSTNSVNPDIWVNPSSMISYRTQKVKMSSILFHTSVYEEGTDQFRMLRIPGIDITVAFDYDLYKRYCWLQVNFYVTSVTGAYLLKLDSALPRAWHFSVTGDDIETYGDAIISNLSDDTLGSHTYMRVAFRQLIKSIVRKPKIIIGATLAIDTDNFPDSSTDKADDLRVVWDILLFTTSYIARKAIKIGSEAQAIDSDDDTDSSSFAEL